MASRHPFQRGGGGLPGSGLPAPRDLVIILAILFATFSMQFFASTAWFVGLLELTPLVLRGLVWQLATYPFIGTRGSGLWFLLELLILFWFARDIYWRLGRRRFWQVLGGAAVAASVAAVVVEWVILILAPSFPHLPFVTMQGQRILLTITIAAFATLYGEATILLFFVLPIRARWFLWLEILFAFVFGVLSVKDVPGFVGVCVAVFTTYASLSPGGPGQVIRRWRKQLEMRVIQYRLDRMRRRRRFDVIDGDRDRDRDRDGGGWVN